jgi:archaellum component FlaC
MQLRKATRQLIIAISLTLVAGLAVACDESKSESVPEQAKEAIDDGVSSVMQEKSAFVEKVEKELADAKVELDQLAAKAETMSDDAKEETQLKLAAAREKWQQTKEQLGQGKNATNDTWGDVKDGIEKSSREMNNSLTSAREWLSDKIAP